MTPYDIYILFEKYNRNVPIHVMQTNAEKLLIILAIFLSLAIFETAMISVHSGMFLHV